MFINAIMPHLLNATKQPFKSKLTQTIATSYLLHLLGADGLVGVRFQVSDVRGVVRRGSGASGFAALELTG